MSTIWHYFIVFSNKRTNIYIGKNYIKNNIAKHLFKKSSITLLWFEFIYGIIINKDATTGLNATASESFRNDYNNYHFNNRDYSKNVYEKTIDCDFAVLYHSHTQCMRRRRGFIFC